MPRSDLAMVLHGTPLGSPPTFIHEHLMMIADAFENWCESIQEQLDDLHTKVSLFRACLQAAAPRLLVADVCLFEL